MFEWLMTAGLGPAVVAVPVSWAVDAIAGAAQGWFRRFRRTDDLSRLVTAAVGSSAGLSKAEFDSVRTLLQDPGTWRLLAGGTVEDLAARIAACLPPGESRAAEDSQVAGLVIARGLLEFTVWNLEPGVFQRVLLARLERMETGQATRLDRALLDLHADLAAGFAEIQEQFERVLDRLPPGPAGRDEIKKYLTTLISWLNADPWPTHRQLDGPVLTPAAIERKLRVKADGQAHRRDMDADELAGRFQRLVILGAPGSGKTWLARRAARRCAEQALRAIQASEPLEDIELPLFTTCSALLSYEHADIRQATVSSALYQLGDLGGPKISAALRSLFTERNSAVLLVLDSLDEAEGSGKQIRKADTLPWRIVLTSRPSSWNGQLAIDAGSDVHQVGELQPLSYPGDVESFIHQWFSQQPGRGDDLVAQIARGPDLQEVATVPLILAFYCIIGAGQPLPHFRRDLYAMVLRRLLTGRWRGDEASRPDAELCLARLREWAWSAAAADPVSGVGRWADTFLAADRPLGGAEDSALDHIATPLRPPDIDTGDTQRRFIHRTVQEHLVAEYVARLPVDRASAELLLHLWYDPDWEYAAPAALVMHDQHDQLLRHLLCHAARSDHVPDDLSVIDGRWEFRSFLARVAAESSPADWSPEIAWTISQARVELARAGRTANLRGVLSWQTSNSQVREALLGLLAVHNDLWTVDSLADVAAGLAGTDQERAHVREALLSLAAHDNDPWAAARLAEVVKRLHPTGEERAQLRQALLGRLAAEHDPVMAYELAETVADLAKTDEERAQVREPLLGLLAAHDDPWMVEALAETAADLAKTDQERAQVREPLLGLAQDYPEIAGRLVGLAAGLAATDQERAQVRDELPRLLAAHHDPEMVGELAEAAAGLAKTEQQRTQVREALLGQLAADHDPDMAYGLVKAAAGQAKTEQERTQVREALLGLLAVPDMTVMLAGLAAGAGLAETAQERTQVREALLGLLPAHDDPWAVFALVEAVLDLDPTEQERARLRGALLRLAARDDHEMADEVAEAAAGLAKTEQERSQVREALLGLLPAHDDNPGMVGKLAETAAGLAETQQERTQVREALLGLLAAHGDPGMVEKLVEVARGLDPTEQERAWLREALLRLIAHAYPRKVGELADAAAGLAETQQERTQVREALLGELAAHNDPVRVGNLAEVAKGLDPTEQERTQLREALLRLLTAHDDPGMVEKLVEVARGLDPTEQERTQLRGALLRLAVRDTGMTGELTEAAARLAETEQEQAQLREALLGLLAVHDNEPGMTGELAKAAARLAKTDQERAQVRETLLELVAALNPYWTARTLAEVAAELAQTEQERTQARKALLGVLAAQDQPKTVSTLAETITSLHPVAEDLVNWRTWPSSPTVELLTAVRQNSVLADWLVLLPSLCSLSR